MARIPRTSARVIPVADDGTCLLLLEQDPARPGETYLSTVGGAVDPGEDHQDAALRELREETGIDGDRAALSGPIHHEVADFSWNGVDYRGDSTFFAIPASRDVSISFDGLEALEVGNVLEARWLTPAEAALDGSVAWPALPDIMAKAVDAVRSSR